MISGSIVRRASVRKATAKVSMFRFIRTTCTRWSSQKSAKQALAKLLTVAALSCTSAAVAVPSFQQAQQEYNAGKYAQALADFEQFQRAYPNNGLVRYYEALCCQALNRLDKAREHYQWVANNCQGSLQALGTAGVAKLANARTQVVTGPLPGTFPTSMGTVAAAPAGQTNSAKKVKKILEFYADW